MSIALRKWAKRIGIGLLAISLFAVLADFSLAAYERWQAERVLTLVRETRIGNTTEAEFIEFARPTLRFTVLHGEWERHGSRTEVSYVVSPLALLHRIVAPWALLQVGVTFENGVAVEKFGLFFTPGLGHPESAVVVYERLRGHGLEPRGSGEADSHHVAHYEGWGVPGNAVNRIRVYDDEQATEAQKQADWNFNLACMIRLRSCPDSRAILPDVELTPLPQ